MHRDRAWLPHTALRANQKDGLAISNDTVVDDKNAFGKNELAFLGHVVGKDGE
ncbi:hypothetical protein G9A89_015744 [Geosiphon pyriformis]|nr:hypothetical protein G9A89_015744 [Geosiphon pyriformis]